MLIPSPIHYTLVTALLAALTAPASLIILRLAGVVSPAPMDFLAVSVSPFACVGIAVLGSRVVHELGRELSEARQLGSYRLVSRLGAGGMGEVWRAEHRMLSRPAAIKLVRPDALEGTATETELTFKRFEREAQATASLRSPYTVDLYDFGRTDDGALYYVMELLEGLDLHRMLGRFGPMPPERVAFIVWRVAHSLKEAHLSGLVHRDIKPANIFVCRYGADLDHVKVLDFGLASLKPVPGKGGDARLTKADSMLGTPGYMAPEMLEDGTAVDARTDLYSLGCVAYWMLAGTTVFPEDSMVGSMIAHTFNQPPPLGEVAGVEVPPALEELVMWCLEKHPSNRPQSAEELAERLRGLGLAETWTPSRAREWWDEHLPAEASGAADG
jgi:serine/threonine-protein kinase